MRGIGVLALLALLGCKGADAPVPQGSKGDPGPAGAQGAAGPTGVAGAQGPQGAAGATGAPGAAGVQGPAGQAGAAGAAGALGPTGPTGPAAAATVWVDATGNPAARFLTGFLPGLGSGVFYFDAQGFVWTLDPEAAAVRDVATLDLFFAGAGCSGAAYVPALPPRAVFSLWGQPGEFARGDAQPLRTVSTASSMTSSGCVAQGFGLSPLVARDGLTSVSQSPPALSGGPWHLEIR